MKKITYILSLIVLIIFMGACEKDFLDINEDPNESVNVEAKLLFMDMVTGHATNYMDIAPTMQFWSQQMGAGSNNAGVFSAPEIYQGLDGFTNSNTWLAYWTGLKSLKLAKVRALDNENINGAAQIDLFKALIYYCTTLMWEDIPFTQAINFEEYPTPDFDSQQTVLEGVIDIVDDALSRIDHSTDFSMDEILYGGDMDQWEKFGNTLKLKTLILLATKEPSNTEYTTDIANIITNGPLMESYNDDMAFPYFDAEGNRNPFFRLLESYANSEPDYLRPGKVLVDLMKDRSDPRLDIWFVKDADDSTDPEHFGAEPGEPNSTETSFLNPATIIAPDAPVFLTTYAEQELYIAEAIIKGWASGTAQDHLVNGVRASLEYWEVPTADADSYIASLINVDGVSEAQALEEIWSEQYITYLMRPHEGFTQQKRTGFPELIFPTGAVLDDFITRWPIPNDEVSSNPNAGNYKKDLTVPMWIDKQ